MKIPYIFTPLLLGIGATLWISASGGVANKQNKDRTGSPVSDVACTQCHAAGANFSTSALIQVLNQSGALVTKYIPGNMYTIKVDIQSVGNASHGFQVTGMLADNSSAGTCSVITPNTQISPLNGRWYFEPSRTVTGGSYEMTWTAPAVGSGTVTFYGSAIAANGNGTTMGDEYVNIPNVTLTEDITSGIYAPSNVELSVYPNPVQSVLNVSSSQIIDRVVVMDITGKVQFEDNVNAIQSEINVAGLPKGTML